MAPLVVKPLPPRVRFLLAWGRHNKGSVFQPLYRTQLDYLLRLNFYGLKVEIGRASCRERV